MNCVQNKGITLVALVVSLIVLLILAGVTINLTLNGGIIGQASKASIMQTIATIKEQIELKKIELVLKGRPESDIDEYDDFNGIDISKEYKDILGLRSGILYAKSGASDEIKEMLGTIKEAEGISSISISEAKKILSLEINGNSVQNGTPTPDNTVAIESLGEKGSFDLKVSGLNRITKQGLSTIITDNFYWSSINMGFTPLSDGWGRYQKDNSGGIETFYINSFISQTAVELKPNTKYTIITEIRRYDVEGTANLWVSQGYKPNDSFVEERNFNGVGIYKSIITSDSDLTEKLGLRIFLSIGAESTATVEARVMLVEGDYTKKDITYESYESTNYTINLSGHEPLRSLPDGTSDYIDFVRGKIVRNIAEIKNYNGEIITGSYMSTTGGLDIGATVIYKLVIPVEENIVLPKIKMREGAMNITCDSNVQAKIVATYI